MQDEEGRGCPRAERTGALGRASGAGEGGRPVADPLHAARPGEVAADAGHVEAQLGGLGSRRWELVTSDATIRSMDAREADPRRDRRETLSIRMTRKAGRTDGIAAGAPSVDAADGHAVGRKHRGENRCVI